MKPIELNIPCTVGSPLSDPPVVAGESDVEHVSAFTIRHLAIHKAINGSGWSVTHIDTGLAVFSNRKEEKKHVIRAMKALELVFDTAPAGFGDSTQSLKEWANDWAWAFVYWRNWLDARP